MEGVNPYLELLKDELLEACSKVEPSINKYRVLQSADFRRIAEIIKRQLDELHASNSRRREGNDTSVSESTLKRIFRYGYIPENKDRRVGNTLDKLSVFLGYDGWADFTAQKNVQFSANESIESILVDVVTKANDAEFAAYKALPEISTEEVCRYIIPDGPAYLNIYKTIVAHSRKQWTIGNAENASHHIMRKIWIESLGITTATVKTKEYWYLRWFELPTQLYRHIYNEENEQTWTLKVIDGEWKVESTYYPSPKNSVQITHVVFAYLPKTIQVLIKKFLSSSD